MMKNVISAFLAICFSLAFCHAQTIDIEKGLWGVKFSQDGKAMGLTKVKNTIQYANNPQALRPIQQAFTYDILSYSSAFVFTVALSNTVANTLLQNDVNSSVLLVGGGALGAFLIFGQMAENKAVEAVKLYNKGLKVSHHYTFKPELRLQPSASGFGMSMTF